MTNRYDYVKSSIGKRRMWVDTLKEGKPCADCERFFPPYCMDYHHLDPATKKFNIGNGSYRNSRELILAEIKKCVLVCACCHRIREYEEKRAARGLVTRSVS